MYFRRIIIALLTAAPLAFAGAGGVHAEIDLLKNNRLIEAAKANDLKEAESLLSKKHNVDVREQNGQTPLFFAAARGGEDFVDLLLRHEARINILDKFGNSPLYYAAAGNHVGVIEMLIEGGANPNIQNRRGLTPLMIAASEGHLASVQVLLDAKSDTSMTDFTGRTALDWAKRSNRQRVIRFMTSAGIGG